MKPFQFADLFGTRAIGYISVDNPAECNECGALVTRPITHKEWHNKVADL